MDDINYIRVRIVTFHDIPLCVSSGVVIPACEPETSRNRVACGHPLLTGSRIKSGMTLFC
jgi:hypothetical protein